MRHQLKSHRSKARWGEAGGRSGLGSAACIGCINNACQKCRGGCGGCCNSAFARFQLCAKTTVATFLEDGRAFPIASLLPCNILIGIKWPQHYIQRCGRSVRAHSHADVPEAERQVKFKILQAMLPEFACSQVGMCRMCAVLLSRRTLPSFELWTSGRASLVFLCVDSCMQLLLR